MLDKIIFQLIKKRQSYSGLPFLFLVLWIIHGLQVQAASQPGSDIKAIWIVRNAILNRNEIDRVVDTIVKCGFTDVFLQVVGRGDAYYKSKILPFSEIISDTTFDPLQYWLLRTQGKGIRTHVWINTFLVWSGNSLPKNPYHIRNVHPDWFVTHINGKSILEKNKNGFDRMNNEGYFLSPSSKDVQSYLLRVAYELVTTYSIDGIHLDYLRYPDAEYDYSLTNRSEFMEQYFIDPARLFISPDSIIRRYGHFAWSAWVDEWTHYQNNFITVFIQNFSQKVKNKQENIILSVAVNPDYQVSKHRFYQDWKDWVSRGYIDYLVPMNYTPDSVLFKIRKTRLDSLLTPQQYVMGISTYNQTFQQFQGKVQISLENRTRGISVFSFDQMTQSASFLKFMKQLRIGEEKP